MVSKRMTRHMSRGGPGRVAVVTLVAGLMLASCGGAEPSTPADPDASGTPSETEASGSAGAIEVGDDAAAHATEVFDRFNAMSGQERHDALVSAAQEEGAVVFYSTAPGWDPVIEAFEETYDLEVERYIGRSDTILQRVTQEYEAGVYAVDVFEDEAAALLSREAGITSEYVNDELTSQIPGYDPEGGLVPLRLSVPTVAWNTNLVDESELPESIEGFADPRWDGRLALDAGAWPWFTAISDYLAEHKGFSQEQIDEFFETIIGYATVHENSIAMTELLIAEELDVGLSVLSQVIDRNKAVGAPITWQRADGSFVGPLAVQPEGAVLMKAAPHPAAALLLVDFMLKEGQSILQEAGTFVPTAVPQAGGPLEGIADEAFQPVDEEKFYAERDRWSTAYDELIRAN